MLGLGTTLSEGPGSQQESWRTPEKGQVLWSLGGAWESGQAPEGRWGERALRTAAGEMAAGLGRATWHGA